MLFAEGVGAGRGGRRVPAGRSGGPRRSGQPPGGMRFQMSGPGSHAGRRFRCDKKKRDIDASKLTPPQSNNAKSFYLSGGRNFKISGEQFFPLIKAVFCGMESLILFL